MSHVELSPCGRWAYVGNRVGVGVDGACANCVEGLISVLRVDGAEIELMVSAHAGLICAMSFRCHWLRSWAERASPAISWHYVLCLTPRTVALLGLR